MHQKLEQLARCRCIKPVLEENTDAFLFRELVAEDYFSLVFPRCVCVISTGPLACEQSLVAVRGAEPTR